MSLKKIHGKIKTYSTPNSLGAREIVEVLEDIGILTNYDDTLKLRWWIPALIRKTI